MWHIHWNHMLQNAEWHIIITDSSPCVSLTLGSLATKSGIIVLVHKSQSGNFEASLLILIMSSSSCKEHLYMLTLDMKLMLLLFLQADSMCMLGNVEKILGKNDAATFRA